MTQRYVAGFLINPDSRTVALVRKLKPEWQKGRLNGVGGKVEPGESPRNAMRREFEEEAGLDIDTWYEFAMVVGDWGTVHFFRAFSILTPQTMEEEPIEVHSLDAIPYDEALPNLSWLIPLALYTHDRYDIIVAYEE